MIKLAAVHVIWALILASSVAVAADAQTNIPPPVPAAPPIILMTPTPAEAQQLLAVLQDQTKRQQLVTTLQEIAKEPPASTPATTPAPGATTPGVPKSPFELLITRAATEVSHSLQDIAKTALFVTHFPTVRRWAVGELEDADIRLALLTVLTQLAALMIVAIGIEWAVKRLLQHSYRSLAGSAGSDVTRAASRTSVLRRLPLILGALVIDLLPIAAFALIGNLGVVFLLGADEVSGRACLTIVNAYVVSRATLCFVRILVAPDGGRLRLLAIDDAMAGYALRWVRRITLVAVFGTALTHIGVLFGVPRAAEQALLNIISLIVHLCLVVIVLQCRGRVARLIHARADASGSVATIRNVVSGIWHYIAIFYILGFWVIWAIQIKDGISRLFYLFFASFAVLLVARVVSVIALGIVEHALHGDEAWIKRVPTIDARAGHYYELLRTTVWAVVGIATIVALLEVWGFDVVIWFWAGHTGNRMVSAAITIAVAAIVAVTLWEAVNATLDRRLAQLSAGHPSAGSARIRTLLPIIRTAFLLTLIAIVGLTVLSEVGINIGPLLAGAGIIGVALGFGSQKLVQDLITGLFLLIENAMQVGDWVTVAGLSGSVENLSIRTIHLRAGDGSVHIIPFSAVTSVTNTNRGIGNAAVSVNIAIGEDIDRVCEVLKEIAAEIRQDPDFQNLILSDLQLWGVDKVDAAMVTIVGQIVCTDNGRWGVQREYNRRLKIRFQLEGIEIANPAQTIIVARPSSDKADTATAKDGPDDGEAGTTPASRIKSPPPAALSNER